MLSADNLDGTKACIDGKWVVARPLSFCGLYGLVIRVKDAYAVLVGKADAVKFYKQ
jgi:hypothetical protein